ncbi:Protein of unknown function [Actinacidiphila yanglinensis]|uniref:DUF4232 domain-containing protein n=1 Tax=Actinacidiphila yanglinensis TaxID=310779 RepID=A0A1H5ZXZ0_9ACTN|nr:DUF4232 domain-containing protein [Actinacidiphila yanglinensis]SEG41071.1 Protein of unknown function [Actinacidiphila yanglinensis]
MRTTRATKTARATPAPRQRRSRAVAVAAVALAGTTVLGLGLGGCGSQSEAGVPGAVRTARAYSVHTDTLPPDFGATHPVPSPVTPVTTTPHAPPTPTCTGTGARVGVGPVDGAMGLRQVLVTLTNCGTTALAVDGYPRLRLLDEDGRTVDVQVHHGNDIRDSVTDPGPTALTLRPGGRAVVVLAWRNTVVESTVPATSAATLEFTLDGGKQRVPLYVDLGNTGRLDVTAWHRPE